MISKLRIKNAIGLSLAIAITPLASQANDCSAPETFYYARKCVSDIIRSLDEALMLQLTKTTEALSQDGKKLIENDQASWEQSISDYCIGTTEKPVEDIDTCLMEHFEDRITTLAFYQSQSLPYPVISRHVFRSQTSSAQIDWIESASYITRFPQIDLGALSGDLLIQAVKINQWLAALTGEEKPSSDSDFSKTIVVNRPLTNIYKAASVVTQYGHGAAHPTYLEERFYFSLASTGPLKANDLFVDPRWQTILSALTFNYLSANLRDNLWQKTPLELVDLITDTKRWEISRDYLTILFNPYEVASFSDGIQKVSLRWENISGLLTESWKTEVLN